MYAENVSFWSSVNSSIQHAADSVFFGGNKNAGGVRVRWGGKGVAAGQGCAACDARAV